MHDNDTLHTFKHENETLLDQALKSYSAQAPREGLEQRILARVASQTPPRSVPSAWRLALAGFAIAAAVLAVLFFLPLHQSETPKITSSAVVSTPPPQIRSSTQMPTATEVETRVMHRRTRAPRRAVSKPFPIPQPSPQEQLLISATPAQRKALQATLRQAPVSIAPIQISQLRIQPITIQPLAQKETHR